VASLADRLLRTGKLNSRSAYERASPVSLERICGKPAAASVIRTFFCVAR
jgi:hypothetical protein